MTLDKFPNLMKEECHIVQSLENLKLQQKKLAENFEKVKNCIQYSTDKKCNSLRIRERQLIRQAEVVTFHQRSILDSKIAKLLQKKGSVLASKEIMHHCKCKDFKPEEALQAMAINNKEDIHSLKREEKQKLISIQFDSKDLDSAIASFGKVQMPDLNAKEDDSNSISAFPASIEDYGDSDHDVLHKSIGKWGGLESDEDGSTTIKVQIPKIPQSKWLANSSSSSSAAIAEDWRMSGDVSTWLESLCGTHETEKGSDTSFELVEPEGCEDKATLQLEKKGKSRCTSVSSSIEVISSNESEKDSFCHVSDNVSDMKNCWLNRSSDCEMESPTPIDMEEFACQANEPCKSYNVCLFDGYCKEVAKERASQTSKWLLKSEKMDENIKSEQVYEDKEAASQSGLKRKLSISEGGKEVIKHMKFILNSDNNRWLYPTAIAPSDLNDKDGINRNISAILYKSPSHTWLNNDTTDECPELPNVVKYSPHSNIWLLHKLKESRKLTENQKSKALKNSENISHNALLLSDLKGALAELSVILPKYSASAYNESNSGPTSYKNKINNTNPSIHDNRANCARNFQWLLRRSECCSKYPLTSNDGLSKGDSSSSGLPDSLVQFAEKDLDKWLLNRK